MYRILHQADSGFRHGQNTHPALLASCENVRAMVDAGVVGPWSYQTSLLMRLHNIGIQVLKLKLTITWSACF